MPRLAFFQREWHCMERKRNQDICYLWDKKQYICSHLGICFCTRLMSWHWAAIGMLPCNNRCRDIATLRKLHMKIFLGARQTISEIIIYYVNNQELYQHTYNWSKSYRFAHCCLYVANCWYWGCNNFRIFRFSSMRSESSPIILVTTW